MSPSITKLEKSYFHLRKLWLIPESVFIEISSLVPSFIIFVERVILNVLSNAVKYTQEKGNIKIYVGFVYNDAYIKVIDNGIGIPKEDLARVFERFYRVDKARSREMGGTGLGLSIAKEIIEQNNGSIDIKSELGKGTEVVIRIPAVKKS